MSTYDTTLDPVESNISPFLDLAGALSVPRSTVSRCAGNEVTTR